MPRTVIADIKNNTLPILNIKVGNCVVWRNLDPTTHSAERLRSVEPYFSAGPLAPGETSSPVKFEVEGQLLAHTSKPQPGYDSLAFNYGHFAEAVVLRGNPKVDRPTVLIPAPNNLVDEYIEEKSAEVLFTPGSDVSIEVGDESDAKLP